MRCYFYTAMVFEFDEAKNLSNQSKHGIDFFEAQKLWDDPDALELPARSGAESRRMIVARHKEVIWAAIFTERGNAIRIISVRRARTNEEALYEHADENDINES